MDNNPPPNTEQEFSQLKPKQNLHKNQHNNQQLPQTPKTFQ